MVIQWLGQSCFQFKTKPSATAEEATIVLDPYSPDLGLKLPRNLSADLLLMTHDHDDHAYHAGVSGNPFVIQGPGEYEAKGVFVYGIATWHDQSQGKERGVNTMYRLESEGLTIAHLGDLGHPLSDAQLDQLDGIDILLVPVGGATTLDAAAAVEVVQSIEPRIVIPMHYHLPSLKVKLATVDVFLKALGAPHERVEKLKMTKKDLPQEDMRCVVLEQS